MIDFLIEFILFIMFSKGDCEVLPKLYEAIPQLNGITFSYLIRQYLHGKPTKNLPRRKIFYVKSGNPCWRIASYTSIAAVFERFNERTLSFIGIFKK